MTYYDNKGRRSPAAKASDLILLGLVVALGLLPSIALSSKRVLKVYRIGWEDQVESEVF